MEIKYRTKRSDLIKVFFISLRQSPRARYLLIGMAAVVFASSLYLRYRQSGALAPADFIFPVSTTLLALALIPALALLTARTYERTVAIHPEGIHTGILDREVDIPWTVIDRIEPQDDRLLIYSKNGNSMTLPAYAFSDEAQRSQFIQLARQYLEGSRSKKVEGEAI